MFEISDMRRREILILRSVCPLVPQGGGGGGGDTQIFSYILRPGLFFGFKILNFNIFGGMKILWIFFGGHHKIGLYLEVISMHLRVKVQNGGYFLGC